MIDEIQVRNLALIREASLRPSEGLTVITGETGAGKTALLASCRLLMGQRADHDMVRQGEKEAEVQGRLFLPSCAMPSEDGGDAPEGVGEPGLSGSQDRGRGSSEGMSDAELVVDRRVSADGRSHVRMNGRLASVAELSEAVSPYVGLCSQHDQQLLSKPAAQRRYLDLWAASDRSGLIDGYRKALDAAKAARHALDDVMESVASSDARVEDARFKLRQIESLNPSQEDYDELVSSLRKAENAELLARSAAESHDALSGEGGALDALNAAIALLCDGAQADESLSPMSDSLREAVYVVEDVARDVSRYRDAIDLDVSSLEQMQERVAAYQSLFRAYGPTVRDVCAVADEARAVVEAVEDADAAVERARAALAQAESGLRSAGEALHEARAAAAPELALAVSESMSRLDMPGAALVVQVDTAPFEDWSESGPDSVSFLFRPGQGMQARPLSRIASGGELSRVMLALHAAMGTRDEVPTLVFDEIDAGVGGAAALALADVLGELSRTHQVIVVTHLAQVASRASVHYVASKQSGEDAVFTSIEEVSGSERTREIARMLSGSITESSLRHAEELQRM